MGYSMGMDAEPLPSLTDLRRRIQRGRGLFRLAMRRYPRLSAPEGSAVLERSRPGTLAKAAALSLAGIGALGLSCDLPPTFGDEYYDDSANFVAAYPFASPTASADSKGATELGTTGAWDWAWRGQAGNAFAYMSVAEDGTAGVDVADSGSGFALASTETAWRLSLANLASNPFFEGGTSDGWEAINTASKTITMGGPPYRHERYLALQSQSAPPTYDWAGFNPSFPGFILDGAASGEFRLCFFAPQQGIKYLVDSQTGVSFSDPKTVIEIDDYKRALEPFTITDADTRVMFAKSNGGQTLDVDDVRIVRHDLKELSSLRLYLAPADTTPSLVPGKYEFSVWVRRPPDALAYSSADRAYDPDAEFAATKVTLVMRQVGFLDDVSAPYYFAETYDVGDGWARLSVRMGDGNMARFDETSSEPVLELAIYPFDPVDMDSGSIQVAAPSLRFFVDGYPD